MPRSSNADPYITGVVFNDTAGKGEYQPGEGLAGVTISVSGVGTTTTMDAGGYSLQVPPGIYTVTASGGGLPSSITRTVVVQNQNMRLNFDENPNGATLSAASDGSVSGLLGSFLAMETGDTASNYSVRIDWGDGNASFATLVPGPDGTFDVEGSNTYADNGVYSVRVLVTHLSDGQTFALNATAYVGSAASPTSSNPGSVNPWNGGTTQTGSGQASTGSGQASTGSGVLGQVGSVGGQQDSHHKKKSAKSDHQRHKATPHKAKTHPTQSAKKTRHMPV